MTQLATHLLASHNGGTTACGWWAPKGGATFDPEVVTCRRCRRSPLFAAALRLHIQRQAEPPLSYGGAGDGR